MGPFIAAEFRLSGFAPSALARNARLYALLTHGALELSVHSHHLKHG